MIATHSSIPSPAPRLFRLTALLLAVLLAAPAWAATPDGREKARSLFEAAQKAYAQGQYEDALDGYRQAYRLSPLAPLLFDIAQCERKLQRWAAAETDYRHYLRAAPTAPNRALVQTLAEEMHAKAQLAAMTARMQKSREQAAAPAGSGARSGLASPTGSAQSGAPANESHPQQAAPTDGLARRSNDTAPSAGPSGTASATGMAPTPNAASAAPSQAAPSATQTDPETLAENGAPHQADLVPHSSDAASPLSSPVAQRDVAPSPFYTRWWFWTGVGVVAAGTAAAVIAGSSHSSSATPTTLGEVNLR